MGTSQATGLAQGMDATDSAGAELRRNIAQAPLEHLDYFVEWGGPTWNRLTRNTIDSLGVDWFQGKSVLELGCRRAKMSCLFSLLGASVVAIDHNADYLEEAKQEVDSFGLLDKVDLQVGDATQFLLDCDRTFDLIFTKSVLVVVPDIAPLLAACEDSLAEDGTFIAIENGKGNALLHWMRRFRHKKYFQCWDYFDAGRVAEVGRHFDDFKVERTTFPPIFSMMGKSTRKRKPRIPR